MAEKASKSKLHGLTIQMLKARHIRGLHLCPAYCFVSMTDLHSLEWEQPYSTSSTTR